MRNPMPAEAFSPGDFIREEMETRGWLPADLARRAGWSIRFLKGLIDGKRALTADAALALADAFGTSAEYWMNLESSYQLQRARLRQVEPLKKNAVRNRKRIA